MQQTSLQAHKGDQPLLPMSLVASLDTVPVTCCVPLQIKIETLANRCSTHTHTLTDCTHCSMGLFHTHDSYSVSMVKLAPWDRSTSMIVVLIFLPRPPLQLLRSLIITLASGCSTSSTLISRASMCLTVIGSAVITSVSIHLTQCLSAGHPTVCTVVVKRIPSLLASFAPKFLTQRHYIYPILFAYFSKVSRMCGGVLPVQAQPPSDSISCGWEILHPPLLFACFSKASRICGGVLPATAVPAEGAKG